MNSLINNYAIEIKVGDQLTGHMFLNKEGAEAVAKEVRGSHGNMDGHKQDRSRFEDIWNHFDINEDGLVEVERMPQFLRMFTGNSLDLEMQ